ncbi:phosphoribosylformylglycinamidine cyclo-ligase [Actinomyces vulturis]|uniref:phosphoribosylformylglycinamidine cyclo-ligase n=1 Tax=Actinomyces vulturis TaxID=1857645 RepID=UPI00082DF945|nr:phosphoribosylformylglycinamidine cyclo-ligase [Actinomyces vulturis]
MTTPTPYPVENTGVTYAQAGVDTEAGDRAVELMKASVAATMTPAVVGGVGGFAGMVDVSDLREYSRPLLATSTDGVGTKVAIAQALDIHDTIGQDLVGMVVDDIVVVGAKPLLMTDYIACGHVVPERIADIVRGVAQACAAVRTPLLGGETAEHPGLMAADEYDVAGAATGVVEASRMLGAERVRPGDVLIAIASSGLHSNGYSLVRRVAEVAGWKLDDYRADLGHTIGEELLVPTALYASLCLDLIEAVGQGEESTKNCPEGLEPLGVHALSHVTGGGLAANVSRVLPQGLIARISRDSWEIPPIFSMVQTDGGVPFDDLESTLNLGVGMVAIVDRTCADSALTCLNAAGASAWILGDVHAESEYTTRGRVVRGTKGVDGGGVDMLGNYRVA